MRWVRYSDSERTGYGLLEDDTIAEVDGSPFDTYSLTGRQRTLSEVTIEVPVIPPTFYCVGRNYAAHVTAHAHARGEEPDLPRKPDIGYRAINALLAHEQTVRIPADAGPKIHYEGELVAVIGKRVKDVPISEALDCVLGYTIGNDVSERDWQKSDRTFWRAKNTDTFKPMGPWIETDVSLDDLETIVRVNGVEKTRFKTNDMLFGVAEFIAEMSRYLTLVPGDVIWMGTDGVSPDLVDGDTVEVEIAGIGVLRNRFERVSNS